MRSHIIKWHVIASERAMRIFVHLSISILIERAAPEVAIVVHLIVNFLNYAMGK